jgi:hypothetical protein
MVVVVVVMVVVVIMAVTAAAVAVLLLPVLCIPQGGNVISYELCYDEHQHNLITGIKLTLDWSQDCCVTGCRSDEQG